jgi:hypothetical protein
MRIALSSGGVSVHRVQASLVCQMPGVVQRKLHEARRLTIIDENTLALRIRLLVQLIP